MPLAGSNLFAADVVKYIAEIIRQFEPTDSLDPSRGVVAFVSACRELRVSGVPVSTGLVRNVARLDVGRKVFRVVSAVASSKKVFALLIGSWSATLQNLRINRCRHIADVSALAQCSSLRTLDLEGCKAIADVSSLA